MRLTLKPQWLIAAGALAALALMWRFFGPVYVSIASEQGDLPFTVQALPAGVWAMPGQMMHVQYRIRNNDLSPLEARADIQVLPAGAQGQMEVFLSQCAGLNTFQNSVTSDYDVFFRVQPAGLLGSSVLTLEHVFTRANTRAP